MKFFILLMFVSFSALAAVTPAQLSQIQQDTSEVMMTLADSRLNPVLHSVRIADELGSRVKVKFTFSEDMYGKKNCSYYYDLSVMAPVANSVLCGL